MAAHRIKGSADFSHYRYAFVTSGIPNWTAEDPAYRSALIPIDTQARNSTIKKAALSESGEKNE
jgi:hypothetical protein